MMAAAAAALSIAVLAGSAGTAAADGGVVPPIPGLPTVPVTVPTLPVPTPPVPTLPAPSVPAPPTTGPSDPGSGDSPASGGSKPGTGTGAKHDGGKSSSPDKTGAKARSTVVPMIAGTPGASDVVDDESTPAMHRASKDFLSIDEKIAALTKAGTRWTPTTPPRTTAAATYESLQTQAAATRSQAGALHSRYDRLHQVIVNDAVPVLPVRPGHDRR